MKRKLKLTQPIKWFGGKRYLAPKIIALMPKHLHYCEPFFGGGAVLLARDPDDPKLQMGTGGSSKGVSEVVNDLDGPLSNFWKVLGDSNLFPEFFRRVNAVPVGREFWKDATAELNDSGYFGDDNSRITEVVAFFVHCRQSRAGMRKDFTSLTRNRTRRGMNGNVSEWLGAVDGLPDVHERLRRVVVESMDAMKLIRREDEPTTLFYLDPPYLSSTRTAGGYACEMTVEQHQELLDTIRDCKGKVILSGYPSEMYDAALVGWSKYAFDLPNNAAGGDSKRRMVESLWCNF